MHSSAIATATGVKRRKSGVLSKCAAGFCQKFWLGQACFCTNDRALNVLPCKSCAELNELRVPLLAMVHACIAMVKRSFERKFRVWAGPAVVTCRTLPAGAALVHSAAPQ